MGPPIVTHGTNKGEPIGWGAIKTHCTAMDSVAANRRLKTTIVTATMTKLICWKFSLVMLRSKITELIGGEFSYGRSLQDLFTDFRSECHQIGEQQGVFGSGPKTYQTKSLRFPRSRFFRHSHLTSHIPPCGPARQLLITKQWGAIRGSQHGRGIAAQAAHLAAIVR